MILSVKYNRFELQNRYLSSFLHELQGEIIHTPRPGVSLKKLLQRGNRTGEGIQNVHNRYMIEVG